MDCLDPRPGVIGTLVVLLMTGLAFDAIPSTYTQEELEQHTRSYGAFLEAESRGQLEMSEDERHVRHQEFASIFESFAEQSSNLERRKLCLREAALAYRRAALPALRTPFDDPGRLTPGPAWETYLAAAWKYNRTFEDQSDPEAWDALLPGPELERGLGPLYGDLFWETALSLYEEHEDWRVRCRAGWLVIRWCYRSDWNLACAVSGGIAEMEKRLGSPGTDLTADSMADAGADPSGDPDVDLTARPGDSLPADRSDDPAGQGADAGVGLNTGPSTGSTGSTGSHRPNPRDAQLVYDIVGHLHQILNSELTGWQRAVSRALIAFHTSTGTFPDEEVLTDGGSLWNEIRPFLAEALSVEQRPKPNTTWTDLEGNRLATVPGLRPTRVEWKSGEDLDRKPVIRWAKVFWDEYTVEAGVRPPEPPWRVRFEERTR